MKKRIERKTVFLYPAFSGMDRETVFITNELITTVNFVVRAANDSIKNIMTQGGFPYINCFPTVSMKSISEDTTTYLDGNNVRICILKYNDIDYSGNYESLIKDYKSGRSDISHLVAVSIQDRDQKVQFEVDSAKDFDVVVKSNMDRLQHVLVAIMLDISLYHYFLQSDSLNDRKDFNKVKINYISDYWKEELQSLYAIKEKYSLPAYLPFSWKFATKYERYKLEDQRLKQVGKVIDDYATFLVNTIAYKVIFNNRGSIADNPTNKSIKNFNLVQEFVTKTYNEEKRQKISFIVPDNATQIDQINMIDYHEEDSNRVCSWMKKELEGMGSYQIIIAERK